MCSYKLFLESLASIDHSKTANSFGSGSVMENIILVVQGLQDGRGPDRVLKLLFYENPTSRAFLHRLPDTRFSFVKKVLLSN